MSVDDTIRVIQASSELALMWFCVIGFTLALKAFWKNEKLGK